MKMYLPVAAMVIVAWAGGARAEDENADLIVQLSYVATVDRCAQGGIEFTIDERNALGARVMAVADGRGVSNPDRSMLWVLGQSMAITEVTAEACAKAREELPTWFPEE